MSNEPDLNVFPVTGFTIGPAPAIAAVIFRPDFLQNLSQSPEDATIGRHYALTPVQARQLVDKILEALDVLEKSHLIGLQGHKH